jgi:hypothetical protein
MAAHALAGMLQGGKNGKRESRRERMLSYRCQRRWCRDALQEWSGRRALARPHAHTEVPEVARAVEARVAAVRRELETRMAKVLQGLQAALEATAGVPRSVALGRACRRLPLPYVHLAWFGSRRGDPTKKSAFSCCASEWAAFGACSMQRQASMQEPW